MGLMRESHELHATLDCQGPELERTPADLNSAPVASNVRVLRRAVHHPPASTTEALDRLEQRAGPQARAMLQQFLEQVKEVEAKYREEESTD